MLLLIIFIVYSIVRPILLLSLSRGASFSFKRFIPLGLFISAILRNLIVVTLYLECWRLSISLTQRLSYSITRSSWPASQNCLLWFECTTFKLCFLARLPHLSNFRLSFHIPKHVFIISVSVVIHLMNLPSTYVTFALLTLAPSLLLFLFRLISTHWCVTATFLS